MYGKEKPEGTYVKSRKSGQPFYYHRKKMVRYCA